MSSNHAYKRIETGVVQFEDDWPGVFIRGDDAFAFTMALDSLVLAGSDSMAKHMVKSLHDLLRLSGVGKHGEDEVQVISRERHD